MELPGGGKNWGKKGKINFRIIFPPSPNAKIQYLFPIGGKVKGPGVKHEKQSHVLKIISESSGKKLLVINQP